MTATHVATMILALAAIVTAVVLVLELRANG